MKNKYLLKSNINNAHRNLCQDSDWVTLERIDSTFAKLLYTRKHVNGENHGLFASHVKGLNLLSKKSLFMDYADDEPIKKYNQKANAQTTGSVSQLDTQFNEIVLDTQKQNTQTLSKHLSTQGVKSRTMQHNSDFFDAMEFRHDKDSNIQTREELHSTFRDLKSIIASCAPKQSVGIKSPLLTKRQSNTQPKRSENGHKNTTDSMTLVLANPYKLRNYSFMIPEYITLILNITKKSKLLVYCPLDLSSPLESSEINYLFPIVFNTETKLAAQIPLSIMDYPDFNKQKLRDFL